MHSSENNNKASVGLAGTALGLGAGAIGIQLLQNGGLGNLLGTNRPCCNPPWERDLNYERELTGKDAEIGQLKAQLYTDQQVNALRQELQAGQAAQAVINAQQSGMLGILQTQVTQLSNITGLFIKQPVMAASEAALNAFKATATPANAGGTTGN